MTATPAAAQAGHGESLVVRARAAAGERYLLTLAGLTLVGGALRFATLGLQSFWYDEAITRRLERLSFVTMLRTIPKIEATPPLYYVLAWPWGRFFGTDEAGLRSLSAVIGTALVPALYWAGTRLHSRRAGLVAAALGAFSPYLVWYSQEARAYTLLALLCTLTVPLLVDALERRSSRAILTWGAVAALALFTHYFAVFVVGPELLLLLARSERRRALFAAAAVALVGVVLLPLALVQWGHGYVGWIAGVPLKFRLRETLSRFTASVPPGVTAARVLVPLVLVAAAAAAFSLLRRRAREERRAAALPAGLAAVTLGVPLLGALVGVDYLTHKNMIAAWPLLTLVVAIALAGAGRLGLALAAGLCAVQLAATFLVDADASLQRTDWRGLARVLPAPDEPRILVAVPDPFALTAYTPNLRAFPRAAPVEARRLDFLVPAGDFVPKRFAGMRLVSSERRQDLVWVRYGSDAPQRVTKAELEVLTRAYSSRHFGLETTAAGGRPFLD